jgi:SAM-dependent methyltransferase
VDWATSRWWGVGLAAGELLARALPFRKQAFDTVIYSEVLEHIPEKQKAINEMAHALKTGGLLLLSAPSKKAVDSWNFVFAPVAWVLGPILRRKADRSPYDRATAPKDLREWLMEAGFAIEKFELNVILPPAGYFARLPGFLTSVVLGICGLLERHMKKLLAPRFAWHMVVCGRKIVDNKA